jgi:uncharacterized protein YggE
MMMVALLASGAFGQEAAASLAKEGVISVAGFGEETVIPDVLELDIFVTANAQLGADVQAKYQDSLKRVQDALKKCDVRDMKLEDCGTSINRQSNGNMIGTTTVSKSMRLTIAGVDKLSERELLTLAGRLFDVVSDAGATPGHSTRFTVSDHSAARRRAADSALQAAKANADYLASRANAKVGKLAHLDEIDNLQVYLHGKKGAEPNPQFISQQTPQEALKLRSYTFKPLLVRVSVRAQFYLQSD